MKKLPEGFVIIQGYEKYAINRQGEIWSVSHQKIKSLSKSKDTAGREYYKVDLYNEQGRKTITLHRLLAMYFIPNPEGLPQVDHINNNPLDNRLENLQWITARDNKLKDPTPKRCRVDSLRGRKYTLTKGREEITGYSIGLQKECRLSKSSVYNLITGRKKEIKGWKLLDKAA